MEKQFVACQTLAKDLLSARGRIPEIEVCRWYYGTSWYYRAQVKYVSRFDPDGRTRIESTGVRSDEAAALAALPEVIRSAAETWTALFAEFAG